MNGRRRLDLGPVIFAAVLLFIGGYCLFRNTVGFDMPEGGEDTGNPR